MSTFTRVNPPGWVGIGTCYMVRGGMGTLFTGTAGWGSVSVPMQTSTGQAVGVTSAKSGVSKKRKRIVTKAAKTLFVICGVNSEITSWIRIPIYIILLP